MSRRKETVVRRMSSLEAVSAHLSQRAPLSAAEERQLDLDGDGVVTAVDLLLAQRGLRGRLKPPPLAWLDVPVMGGGDEASISLRTKAPAARLTLATGSSRMALAVRASDKQLTAVIPHLPAEGTAPAEATLWLLTEGHRPRPLHFLYCPGPIIDGARRIDAEHVALHVRGIGEGAEVSVIGSTGKEIAFTQHGSDLIAAIPSARSAALQVAAGRVRSNIWTWAGATTPRRKSRKT
jgi:hypothetical protein